MCYNEVLTLLVQEFPFWKKDWHNSIFLTLETQLLMIKKWGLMIVVNMFIEDEI